MKTISMIGYATRLLGEGAVIARSQWVSSTVTAIMAAGVCVAVLATTGQSATTEGNVLSQLNDVSGRIVTITDQTGEAAIEPATVSVIAHIRGVSSVIGFGPAFDVRQATIGPSAPPVPVRFVYGNAPAQLAVTKGRLTRNNVLVGPGAQRTLGLSQPAGGVTDDNNLSYSVTGSFEATGYLGFLGDGGIISPSHGVLASDRSNAYTAAAATVSTIYVVAKTARDVPGLLNVLPGAVEAGTQKFAISAPTALIRARAVVSKELSAGSRRQLIYVLLAGLVLEAVTMLGAVSQRRRDFGRRRALGASRSAIVLLVLSQTTVPAIVGVISGTAVGIWIVRHLTGSLPPPGFTVGLAVLALLCAMAAAVPPALTSAFRDPVRILRVP